MSCTCVCLETEIQDLRSTELQKIEIILEHSDSWKKLMSVIPREGNGFKFNDEHINMIEEAAKTDSRDAAKIFIDEWSTMGRKAPTLGLLMDLLIKAELFRIADCIACDILNQRKPSRPGNGPAAFIDLNSSCINELLKEQVQEEVQENESINSLTSELALDQNIQYFYRRPHEDNDRNKTSNENLSGIVDEFSNCKKAIDNDPSKNVLIKSDLMKLGTMNAHETVNNHVKYTSPSILASNHAEIEKKISSPIVQPSEIPNYYYEYRELPSQELPVFLNKPRYEESELDNQTLSSSNIPLCVKDLSLQ